MNKSQFDRLVKAIKALGASTAFSTAAGIQGEASLLTKSKQFGEEFDRIIAELREEFED